MTFHPVDDVAKVLELALEPVGAGNGTGAGAGADPVAA